MADTTDGPYEQFEKCKVSDCKYIDKGGRCIYETCVFENELPKTQDQWFFECQICHSWTMRDPKAMKIRICDSCLERIEKAERLPFTCVFCGSSQSTPSKIPLSGICDTCFTKLNRSIHCAHCGNA